MRQDVRLTPAEYIGRVLHQLTQNLRLFVEAEMRRIYREQWVDQAKQGVLNQRDWFRQDEVWWDSYLLLSVMTNHWSDVFVTRFEKGQRSLIFELLDIRNRWAHERPFKIDDAFRAADSAFRLLEAVSSEGATSIRELRDQLLQMMSESSPRTAGEPRGSNAQRVLAYLRSIAPRGATNSEIVEQTGIEPHQTVFSTTRSLAKQNLVRAEPGTDANRREWTFYIIPPNA